MIVVDNQCMLVHLEYCMPNFCESVGDTWQYTCLALVVKHLW